MSRSLSVLSLGKTYTLLFVLLLSIANIAFAKSKSVVLQDTQPSIEQGEEFFRQGDFESAVSHWSSVAQGFAKQDDRPEQISALINLADAYQALGQYPAAIEVLNKAYQLTNTSKNPHQQIITMNSLGAAYGASRQFKKGYELLQKSIKKARTIKAPGLLAASLNNFGNLLTQQKKYDQALASFSESAATAKSANLEELAAKASVNAAIAASRTDDAGNAETILLSAQSNLNPLDDTHLKAFSLITLGQISQYLSANHTNKSRWQSFSYQAYKQAAAIGDSINNPRIVSFATGYLAGLYLSDGRDQDALKLTRQAIFSIENVQAPEILFRWQWQTGRILKSQGKIGAAIPAYQQAVNTLHTTRQDLSANRSGSSSFHEETNLLYLELTDLLLQSTDTLLDEEKLQDKLIAARNTMEQLKAAELQDYFQDDCVSGLQQKIKSLDSLDRRTAAIYPILLSDRTEVLLSLPEGLKRFTIATNRADITKEVRSFRRKLENRTTREYLPHAQKLYEWLIAPLQTTLNEHKIDTLVMVPDESLRTIPMAALHDGKAFLIEQYAIANTPGLNLTDPKPLSSSSPEVLAIGLSEAVQGFPALPHVSSELASINKTFGGQVLLDKEFLLNSVQKELKQTPYNIVHIASHGQFKSDSQENFVLTFDDKLNIDELEQLISLSQFRNNPVELLTLSACQTAAGDDRAALGLAGIAIKAGARSAVATLWFINDQAASKLVSEFYSQLKANSTSKAQALKNAQVYLIKNTPYQHPYFWSPFLLLGNWL